MLCSIALMSLCLFVNVYVCKRESLIIERINGNNRLMNQKQINFGLKKDWLNIKRKKNNQVNVSGALPLHVKILSKEKKRKENGE